MPGPAQTAEWHLQGGVDAREQGKPVEACPRTDEICEQAGEWGRTKRGVSSPANWDGAYPRHLAY